MLEDNEDKSITLKYPTQISIMDCRPTTIIDASVCVKESILLILMVQDRHPTIFQFDQPGVKVVKF